MEEDVGRRADLGEDAVLENRDPIADPERLVEVVRDEDDRLVKVLLEVDELVLHLGADQRIERREGLVHEEDLRVGAQRAGEADALLHAARELARILVLVAGETDRIDPARGLVAHDRALEAAHLQPVADVLDDRAVRHQAEALEDHAHLGAPEVHQRLGIELEHVLALDDDLAVRRVDQPVEMPDQRRLARSRQAHDDEDLALFDVERDVVQAERVAGLPEELVLAHPGLDLRQDAGRVGAEDFRDVADGDLGHGRKVSDLSNVVGGARSGSRGGEGVGR